MVIRIQSTNELMSTFLCYFYLWISSVKKILFVETYCAHWIYKNVTIEFSHTRKKVHIYFGMLIIAISCRKFLVCLLHFQV